MKGRGFRRCELPLTSSTPMMAYRSWRSVARRRSARYKKKYAGLMPSEMTPERRSQLAAPNRGRERHPQAVGCRPIHRNGTNRRARIGLQPSISIKILPPAVLGRGRGMWNPTFPTSEYFCSINGGKLRKTADRPNPILTLSVLQQNPTSLKICSFIFQNIGLG